MIKHLLLSFLFGVLVAYVGVTFSENPKEIPIISPIAESLTQTVVYSFSKKEETNVKHIPKEIIEPILNGGSGIYGIVVKNINTQEIYMHNEHKEFEPASLYKLWIMATAYRFIQEGNLNEKEILSDSVASLNNSFNIASEEAELTEGFINVSVDEALNQMITISHNYDALILTKRIKLANVSKFLIENGLKQSAVGKSIKTSAFDIALFFEKLYTAELANVPLTQKMLRLLEKQTINHKLPKYLPKTVKIAHKTGELGRVTHDAGIVYGTHGDYIIVILSESDSPRDAEERIANISRSVYEYFEK